MSVNKAIILGRVSAAPQTSHLPSGTPVTNFEVVTKDSWIDKSGEKHTSQEWHKIKAFGRSAPIAGQLVEGQGVYVEGKIQTRSWDGQDGQKKKAREINAFQIVPLTMPQPKVIMPQPVAPPQPQVIPQPQPQIFPQPQAPAVAPPVQSTPPPWTPEPPVPQQPVAPTVNPGQTPPPADTDDDLPF